MKRVLSAAALSLLLFGSAAAGAQTLRVALPGDVASTEFTTKHDENTAAVLHQILEPLVAYKEDMTIGPLLAESYTVSPDGRTYTFKLRDGIKFHNGAKLTSAEVKWSWDRYRTTDWGTRCRGQFDGSEEIYLRPTQINSVEAPDVKTVVFHLEWASPLFLHQMASNYCIAGILHPSSVGSDGAWVKPVGTGPFRLKSWVKGEATELERFPDYAARGEASSGFTGNKRAKVEQIRFVTIADPAKVKTALEAGEIDMAINIPLSLQDELKTDKKLRIYPQERLAWQQIVLQGRHDPLLKDRRMRQALAYAIDRGKIAEIATHGLVKPNPSAVAHGTPYFTAAHEKALPYDPARAKKLLAEVGYKGEPIQIQASKMPYPTFFDVATAVVAQWQAAGINASVQEVDWATQDKNYAANKFQASALAFSMRTDPALMYSAMVGQKTDHAWYLWEDPAADLWVSQASLESDKAKRQSLFDRVHAKMIEATPTLGLFNYFTIDAASERVRAYRTFAMGLPRFWLVELAK
jgi:peptide/nickel transport system substrate-binding protein